MPTFVDAEQVAKDWINSQGALVGFGKPIVKGAFIGDVHGDHPSWVEIQLTGGSSALSAENPDHRAALSFLIYGRTREAASRAAVALLNALEACDGRALSGPLVADNLAGPNWSPDGPVARYLLSADLYLRAA